MWTCYVIVLYMLLREIGSHAKTNERQKRYLIFTPATQWGVFATISIPLHPETTVSVAWFYEANYYIIDNSTWLEPLLGDIGSLSVRKRRSTSTELINRSHIYTFIESMLERHGYSGNPCLLRAICENVFTHISHNGIVGELLDLILTPSKTFSDINMDDKYYEAEYNGFQDNCQYYVRNCPKCPLDYISKHIDEIA